MMKTAIVASRVFDGVRLRTGDAVLIADGAIVDVVPASAIPPDYDRQEIAGLIAPGFIDIQVNGGGGVLFNDEPTLDGIAAIGAAHRPFGTTGFLPTLITDTPDVMRKAVAAAQEAMAARVPGLLGIHLEGPFLNPERKGVHRPDYMRPVDADDLALMTAPGAGRVLVTLAPEMVEPEVITRLTEAGIVVSAGHTRASYETIIAARKAGLTGFTHLFNAMPPLAGREPGPVGAALEAWDAWCSIIVDLHHVSAPSLRVAIAARGWERTILVTDAMSSVGSPHDTFDLHGRTIRRDAGRLTIDDGTLAGSDLDMASAVRNTNAALNLPLEAALHMASRAPAEFLGLGGELGQLQPGYRANMVLLSDDLRVIETWIDGQASAGAGTVRASAGLSPIT